MSQPPEWMISVDDHIIEPPHLWTNRVPAKDVERAPHVISGEDGLVYWAYESVRMPISRTLMTAGSENRGLGYVASYDDIDPMYYDPTARLGAMDADGVLASLCFPMFPRFCGQTFTEASDKDFALVCVRAYNDWVLEEWCGAAPGRFIPLIILPLWDPKLAATEIERCAANGAKALSFSENPARLGLPSLHDEGGYWDPVLAAANDTNLAICIHFGSSSHTPKTSDDAPLLVSGSLEPVNLMAALADWVFSGKLIDGDRSPYPNLKICLSEGGIGWIPYILERCDGMLARRPHLQHSNLVVDQASGKKGTITTVGARRMGVPPSELFRRHFYGCFIDDEFGARHLEEIGVDNVMIETDFPHGDSTFPNSLANARKHLGAYDDEIQHKVMIGNACRVFDFEPAPAPGQLRPASAS